MDWNLQFGDRDDGDAARLTQLQRRIHIATHEYFLDGGFLRLVG